MGGGSGGGGGVLMIGMRRGKGLADPHFMDLVIDKRGLFFAAIRAKPGPPQIRARFASFGRLLGSKTL